MHWEKKGSKQNKDLVFCEEICLRTIKRFLYDPYGVKKFVCRVFVSSFHLSKKVFSYGIHVLAVFAMGLGLIGHGWILGEL